MTEYSIGPIDISGYGYKSVPNRFFRNIGSADGLVIILPGLRYTCDMPLLFYPARYFLEKGFDVLQLHTDYTQEQFAETSPDKQIDWLGIDANGAVEAAYSQRPYTRLILIGKSIGTLAMSVLLLNRPELRSHTSIWITPLFRLPLVEQATQQLLGPALFIAGTGDNTFDSERLQYLKSVIRAETLVFNDANHSLEVAGNLNRSLEYLQNMMSGLDDFAEQYLLA